MSGEHKLEARNGHYLEVFDEAFMGRLGFEEEQEEEE